MYTWIIAGGGFALGYTVRLGQNLADEWFKAWMLDRRSRKSARADFIGWIRYFVDAHDKHRDLFCSTPEGTEAFEDALREHMRGVKSFALDNRKMLNGHADAALEISLDFEGIAQKEGYAVNNEAELNRTCGRLRGLMDRL